MSKKDDMEKEYQEFFKGMESETCEVCGGELKPDEINLEEIWKGKLFIMEKVPALICQECGETWVPEKFTKEFEQMVITAKKIKAGKASSGLKKTIRSKKIK